MNRTIQIFTLVFSVSLFGCMVETNSNKKNNDNVFIQTDSAIKISDTILENTRQYKKPHLDSTINIRNLRIRKSFPSLDQPLTFQSAKKMLYTYFKGIGYYIEKIPYEISDSDRTGKIAKDGSYKFVVFFDTLEYIDLNNDRINDAIIEYSLSPPYACGVCVGEPSNAIIVSNGNRFDLIGLEFIPDSFTLDSIKQDSKNSIVLYGYEFNCLEKTYERSFKIHLKLN